MESWTRRLISTIDWDNSFDAVAALRTCSEACLEASADWPDISAVECAVTESCLGILLELSGGIQHLLDDSADLGAEGLDKLIEFRLALLHRLLFGADALGLELAALDAVVLEHVDGASDHADFVVTIGVLNLDIRPSSGEDGQRFRHGPQRLGDAANQHHRHDEREQGGDAGGNGHCADRLPQHAVELCRRNADIDDADHLAGGIKHRLIGRVEATSEQHRRPLVGLATAKHGLPRMICRELGADRPIAIFLFDVRGSADELLGCIVVDEKRGIAADIGGGPVHDPVIGEFRHLRNFNAVDDTVANGDLRIRERFAKCQTERAKAKVDISLRADVEVACQRPVARPDQ